MKKHKKRFKLSLIISLALVAGTAGPLLSVVHAKADINTARNIIFPLIGPGNFSNDYNSPRPAPWYVHEAIDIIANKGQQIVSPVDGVITFVAYPEPDYGYMVTVRDSEGYTYSHLHMNDDTPGTNDGKGGAMNAYAPDIKEGNPVVRGQLLGWVGDSGYSGGVSHLHFEMKAPDDTKINPFYSLVPGQRVSTPSAYPQLPDENLPYGPNFTGGISISMGNYDGDPGAEFVTGAGAGGGPHVRLFDNDSRFTGHEFMAYNPAFTGGIDVASGDVDGDGIDETITGPGPGGGPNVKVFKADGTQIASFNAYDPRFLGGIKVAAADVDGDGKAEIITGPGPGGGPNVKVFKADGTQIASFNAYDSAFTGGIDVASANVTGSNAAEIITGPGPGGGPNVKVFKADSTVLSSFFAYSEDFHGGVRVSAANVKTSTPEAEILTVPASPPGGPNIRMLTYDGTQIKAGNFMESWWEGYSDVGAGRGASLATTGVNRRASVRAGLY